MGTSLSLCPAELFLEQGQRKAGKCSVRQVLQRERGPLWEGWEASLHPPKEQLNSGYSAERMEGAVLV